MHLYTEKNSSTFSVTLYCITLYYIIWYVTCCREGQLQRVHHVLNECLVDRGASPNMVQLEAYVDGHHITTVQVSHSDLWRQAAHFTRGYSLYAYAAGQQIMLLSACTCHHCHGDTNMLVSPCTCYDCHGDIYMLVNPCIYYDCHGAYTC